MDQEGGDRRGRDRGRRCAASGRVSPDGASGWPTFAEEEWEWATSFRSYRASVPPLIAGAKVEQHLGAGATAASARAEQAIRSFDEKMTERLGGLELGTMSTVLLRTEASSSSQIEHLTVSAKQLALAGVGESKSPNAAEVTRNVAAMEAALALSQRIDHAGVQIMHERLMASTSIRPGLREEQVWIGTSAKSPHGADYVAPHHSRLPGLMDDFYAFANQSSPLPLAHIAVAHAQFESIHPFVDGNGRVGRALVHSLLRRAGLAEHVTVPVSAGLLANPSGYIEALTAYRRGEIDPIVERFADAAHAAADIGSVLMSDLLRLRHDWSEQVKARDDSVVHRVLDGLIAHPAVTSGIVAERYGVSVQTALNAVNTLVECGVLVKVSTGRRNRVWVADAVTETYDRVAVLIGRRRPY